MRRCVKCLSLVPLSLVLVSRVAFGQGGEIPPEAKAAVAAPTGPAGPPAATDKPPEDHTTASVSAGTQAASGNSKMYAGSATGVFDMRRGQNAFGLSVIGNYGQAQESPAPTITTTGFGTPQQKTTYTFPNGSTPTMVETVDNIQGRARYDRFITKTTSFFLIGTGRHDKFQGLEFRLNLDPGVKQIFYGGKAFSLWGELGYDFQYDARYPDALHPTDPVLGLPLPGLPPGGLPQTATDHSARAYAGFRDAFTSDVTLTTGVEFLQSLVHVDNTRVNIDALLAAKIWGSLSFGVGWSLRFDNNPLPGKVSTDMTETVNLIYSYADLPKKKPAPGEKGDCNCEKPPEPPSNPNKYAPPAPPPDYPESVIGAPAAPPPPPPPPPPPSAPPTWFAPLPPPPPPPPPHP